MGLLTTGRETHVVRLDWRRRRWRRRRVAIAEAARLLAHARDLALVALAARHLLGALAGAPGVDAGRAADDAERGARGAV